MGNAVVHFEVMGSDLKGLASFYGELFGWHVETMEEMNYGSVDTHGGQGINGGLGVSQDGAQYVTFYIEVPDTDAALKKVEEAGGKTITPTVVMPGIVTFAHFADPAGNRVGLVKEEPDYQGGPSKGDGPEVGWVEALGPDADALATFYTKAFGWTTKRSETPEFIYHEFDPGTDKGTRGGIGGSPEAMVNVYAGVDDVTKTLERAESLGGKTVMPETQVAEDTVIGLFSDPQGNTFGVYKRMPR